MKRTTKIALGIVAAIAAIAIPVATIAGWYPDRQTIEWVGPSTRGFTHVQFNSFYNTPVYGQEMSFFDGKVWDNTPGGFSDPITVRPGQEIKLRTYVHNNINPIYNGPEYNYRGIARNTKVKISLPTGVGTRMNAVSQISASNAQPGSVFDTTNFVSADGTPYRVSYVAGSAYADTNQRLGMPLSDSIVTTGALVGETQPDGNVPGCFEKSMFVVIKVKVEAIPLQVKKTVGFPNQPYTEQVTAKPGDRLYFKVDFKNAGTTATHGVALTDQLPDKFNYLPGTMKLYNANFPNGTPVAADSALFTRGGLGVGDYGPGANGYVTYQVTVKPNVTGTLTNVACVRSTEVPYDTCDDAKVVTPPPVQPQECLPGIPVGDARCTPVPPVTPPTTSTTTTLPQTGIESGIAGLVGMTGLSASVYAYRKSKKAIGSAYKPKSQR